MEVYYPPGKAAQQALAAEVLKAKDAIKTAGDQLLEALLEFCNVIDGRGRE